MSGTSLLGEVVHAAHLGVDGFSRIVYAEFAIRRAQGRDIYTRPFSPWQNGKVERMSCTLAQEWRYARA